MTDKKQEFRIWQTKLYNLQCEAPKPHVVPCSRNLPNRPPQYGIEYHGAISRSETEKLLEGAPDGAYLIRDSQRAERAYTLVIWFDKVAKNYMLYYDPVNKQHYVGENRFDTIELLVADGLIHFYVETRGADVLQKIADANTYESTPFYKMRYHTFNATTLDNAMDQIFTSPLGTDPSKELISTTEDHRCRRLERRVSPPIKPRSSDLAAVPNSRAPPSNSTKQLPLLRRQSIDGAQLARRQILPTVSRDSRFSTAVTPSDWPVLGEKCSDPTSETWRYRVSPPNSEQDESRKLSSAVQPDSAPVPPPRRFGSFTAASRLQPPSLSSASTTTLNDSRTTCSTGERQASYSKSQTTSTTGGKLSHIPEDSDLASASKPNWPDQTRTVPVSCSSPGSRTGSRDSRGSTGSFSSDSTNTATSSSGYSGDHPSRTDTSNSGSVPDGAVVAATSLADSTAPIRLSRTSPAVATTAVTGADRGAPRDGMTNASDGSAAGGTGKNAMLNLQERYNLPAACFGDQIQSIEDSKPHNFKVHTFRGPHWCDYCTHFIWGLVAQGFKCTDCGFQAHKRCSDRVPCDCLPDIKQLKRVFGVDLTSLTRAERKNVPTILVRCVEEIERRGALSYEGLYRIPGNHDRVEQVRASFDKDSESADISPTRIADVNIITSLIKSFLRQLPVPLITYEAYPDFIEVIRNDQMTDEKKLLAIRALLIRLPPAHYESLRYFMRHIHRVAQQRDANMMSAENLAIVLSPSLMTSSYSDPISCMVGTRSEHALVERLIKDFDVLFPAATTEVPVRRITTSDARPLIPCTEENNSKRNSQIVPVPVSPSPTSSTSSQVGYVKRKFLRNRRSVDTPLLAAAAAAQTAAAAAATANNHTSNNRPSSPSPLSSPIAASFSLNTAL